MTENDKNQLRREGWQRCLNYLRANDYLTERQAKAERDAAEQEFPLIDVERAPSGRWYRVMPYSYGHRLQEVRSWETEGLAVNATEQTYGYRIAIEPGDERAVAALLTRHADRAAAERLP